jgi:hypothetical protein
MRIVGIHILEINKMKLTDVEEMDLIRKWLDKKSIYEVWELLPNHVLNELIEIILQDNDNE